ncbi:hypothetical protein [Streptomyces sp. NPDC058773]|uniref:hypothetical protein n=1 Tax=Streptomyces sp. NPDC058773 TaxID=3346632 RepID=UPI003696CD88
MAFSADELRVLRRALAHALQTTPPSVPLGTLGPEWTQDIQDYLRLAEAVDEAVREGGRLRAFLLADLTRYRAALPGSAPGYLARLKEALAAGHVPGPDDLAALRSLPRSGATAECERRRALLRHCEQLAEQSVRTRLRALPGGRCATRGGREPEPEREPKPERKPAPAPAPRPKGPQRDRPIPTPGEVFPPRRKPAPPPESRTA